MCTGYHPRLTLKQPVFVMALRSARLCSGKAVSWAWLHRIGRSTGCHPGCEKPWVATLVAPSQGCFLQVPTPKRHNEDTWQFEWLARLQSRSHEKELVSQQHGHDRAFFVTLMVITKNHCQPMVGLVVWWSYWALLIIINLELALTNQHKPLLYCCWLLTVINQHLSHRSPPTNHRLNATGKQRVVISWEDEWAICWRLITTMNQ